MRVRLADLNVVVAVKAFAREDRRTLDQKVAVPGECKAGPDKQLMAVRCDDLVNQRPPATARSSGHSVSIRACRSSPPPQAPVASPQVPVSTPWVSLETARYRPNGVTADSRTWGMP